MFENYIKNIVNQINHSLHCYFVVVGYPLLSENMVATKMAPEFFPLLF
jgi:hypothetical protein